MTEKDYVAYVKRAFDTLDNLHTRTLTMNEREVESTYARIRAAELVLSTFIGIARAGRGLSS